MRIVVLGLCIWGALALVATGATAGQFKENEVKAAFLFNLTNFITWPQGAFSSPDSEFRIAIVGKDPFGSVLEQIVKGEKVQGQHPVVIRRLTEASGLDSCHLLYVGSSAKHQWEQILQAIEGRSVLTISDIPRFAHTGGMVCLLHKGNRIHIQINAHLVKQKGFRASAKLLKLSTLVQP